MTFHVIIESVRRFIQWTNRKIQIHFEDRPEMYVYERELWWASLGENIGSEANGKNMYFERPVVIVKKFCKDMIFVVPTTTKEKEGSWYYPLVCKGMRTRAILAQARTISPKRLVRKVGNIPLDQFYGLVAAFVGLIKANSPA